MPNSQSKVMQILHHNSQGKGCSKELYQIVLFTKGSKNISKLGSYYDIERDKGVLVAGLSQKKASINIIV